MSIDFAKLNFAFLVPPLVIGGMAMQHYGLRQSGNDIDLVVIEDDYLRLREQYPDHLKELWGDLGVCPFEFEIWRSICLFDYADLSQGALEQEGYRVISLEKLLFLKALGHKIEKNRKDIELIADRIAQDHYAEHFEATIRWASSLPGAENLLDKYHPK